jgi:hypothetical protein
MLVTNNPNLYKKRRPNSTYTKVAVQWLNQAVCNYESSCLVDNEVLRNRQFLAAAKRYPHFEQP